MSTSTRDYRPIMLGVSALVILLDRLSKLWVVKHIYPGEYITIIPGIFRLSHVHNTGAAFSLFADSSPHAVRNSLILFSIAAAIIVFVLLWKAGRDFTLGSLALALILGGALGNLYDRIHLSYVVDFLEVKIVHYHWPDFNLADSCIVIGACLLLIEIFRPQPATPTENV